MNDNLAKSTDEAPEAAAVQTEAETTGNEQAAQIAALQEEIVRLKDQSLRALAEAENTRRRTQKEREDTSKYAVSNFAKDMLAVADNFRRALDAVPKDAANNESLKNLITGIEATERHMLNVFEQFGIRKIDPLHQAFDPNFHRVMTEIEDPDHPAGTIIQVMQSGYMIHDRLLREALVAVSKGGAVAHKVDTSA